MIWLLHDLLIESPGMAADKICLVYGEEAFSYRQIERASKKLAAVLVKSGSQPGDRVAIHFEKCTEEVIAILATSMAGGIFVNINSLLKPRQLGYILEDSQARILITSAPRLKNIGAELSGLRHLKTIIARGDGFKADVAGIVIVNFHVACAESDPVSQSVPRIDSDPVAIIYTSGSTGMPKGVVLSHRNIVAGAQSVASYLHNNEGDRILSLLPFSFDYGLNQLTTTLLVGATLILRNYLTAQDILKTLEREWITGLAAIPTIWSQLLQANWTGERFPSLRYITNSGGRFPEAMVREYRHRLPHTKIYLMYGLTEAFRSTYLDPEQVDIRPTSIGKAIPGAEMLVLDEEDRPCSPGQVGQLVHRGVHVAMGYWNDPARTRERFKRNPLQLEPIQIEELVVYSGDLVKQDEEGYLYFLGRKDSMIKTSGFRVSPTEVEEYFYSTAVVQDAVALGIPDEVLGESILVVVSLGNGQVLTPADLLQKVSRDMPAYMVPKEIAIRQELPRNSNGKIDRAAICQAELEIRGVKAGHEVS